jgi:hypothetical protein
MSAAKGSSKKVKAPLGERSHLAASQPGSQGEIGVEDEQGWVSSKFDLTNRLLWSSCFITVDGIF